MAALGRKRSLGACSVPLSCGKPADELECTRLHNDSLVSVSALKPAWLLKLRGFDSRRLSADLASFQKTGCTILIFRGQKYANHSPSLVLANPGLRVVKGLP